MRIENGQNLLSHGCSSNPNLSMSRNGAALFPTYPWMPFFALSLLSFIRYGHCKKEKMDSPSDQRDGGLRRRSRCEDDGESLNVNSAIRHQQHDTASASADHHSPANNQHRTVPTPDPHIRRSTTGPLTQEQSCQPLHQHPGAIITNTDIYPPADSNTTVGDLVPSSSSRTALQSGTSHQVGPRPRGEWPPYWTTLGVWGVNGYAL